MKRVPIVLKRVPPEAEVQEVRMPTSLGFELRATDVPQTADDLRARHSPRRDRVGAGLGFRLQEFEPEP